LMHIQMNITREKKITLLCLFFLVSNVTLSLLSNKNNQKILS
jgi:hypothetical protein